MQKTVEWFKLWEPGETDIESPYKVGEYPLIVTTNGDYICPQCGQPADYVEGQIDQDFQGNDIGGWWYDCYKCGIGTEPVEI